MLCIVDSTPVSYVKGLSLLSRFGGTLFRLEGFVVEGTFEYDGLFYDYGIQHAPEWAVAFDNHVPLKVQELSDPSPFVRRWS